MKIKIIDSPAAGISGKDCELISSIIDDKNGFILKYHKNSDDTYWSLKSWIIPAYKVIGKEFSRFGYLKNLPQEGAFFEILDSPWIKEVIGFETALEKGENAIPKPCKHCVLQFYDEIIEILAVEFIFEPLYKEDLYEHF